MSNVIITECDYNFHIAFHQTARAGSLGSIGNGKMPEILALFNRGYTAINCGNIDTTLATLIIWSVSAVFH